MPTSRWDISLSKKLGKISSADQLIRTGQDKNGCKRQIQKCITDLNTAMAALAVGMPIWQENARGDKHNLKNYITCNDACLKMEDKFD